MTESAVMTKLEACPPIKRSTYLLLVLYHRTVTFFTLPASTCDNRRIRDRDVEAPSQNPVDACNGVRYVVFLAFSWTTIDVDINPLVVRSWHDAQRCA